MLHCITAGGSVVWWHDMNRIESGIEEAVCAFSPSGSLLAVATTDGLLKTFDTGPSMPSYMSGIKHASHICVPKVNVHSVRVPSKASLC